MPSGQGEVSCKVGLGLLSPEDGVGGGLPAEPSGPEGQSTCLGPIFGAVTEYW